MTSQNPMPKASGARAIAVVGAPGSGKSTVGPVLAKRLGLEFLDVDAVIEAVAGKSVQEIFAEDGESVFRALEVEHTLAQLRRPVVVSLGGGAVMSEAIQAGLRDATVVWLQVSAGKAAQRVGLNTARPLLLGNVRSTLVKLLAARTPIYSALAQVSVETDDLSPFALAERIIAAIETDEQAVGRRQSDGSTLVEVHAEQPYAVRIGRGTVERLVDHVGTAARVALIHPASVAPIAERAAELVRSAGAESVLIEVPDAERAKDAAVLLSCWDTLAEAGFTRSDLVVGIGGGATTDLAGFVAASWLRGVRLVNVPTTVLGMVDAAVGGKTGINIAAGKNLVGAFYEPTAVLVDLDLLAGLAVDDLRGGLAEVIKTGFIADPIILDLVEGDPEACLRWDSAVLAELITRSIAVKARVVSADLRESTSTGDQVGRELLNYGHTLAHAIERREQFTWRHGEAVSVGLVFVAELARRAGLLDDETAGRHRQLLALVGLPVHYDTEALPELLTAMALDKKTRGSTLRFVVLTGVGRGRILAGPEAELVTAAYAVVAGQQGPSRVELGS